jgi:hypothetical protein
MKIGLLLYNIFNVYDFGFYFANYFYIKESPTFCWAFIVINNNNNFVEICSSIKDCFVRFKVDSG